MLFTRLGDHGLRGDEGFYGLVVAEMLESGDWSRLRLEGAPFLNKPPLAFWTMAASARALGLSEASLRLPGALASAAVAALVFAVALRRVGAAGALVATVLVVSAPHALRFHGWRGAVTEPWLTLWCLLLLVACGRIADRRRLLAAAGSIAFLAALTKGLVAPALVSATLVLAAALFALARRRPTPPDPPAPAPRPALAPALPVAATIAAILIPALVVYLGWWLWNMPSIDALLGFIRSDWLARAAGTLQQSHVQPWSYFPRHLAGEFGVWLLLGIVAWAPARWRAMIAGRDLEGILLALFPLVVLFAFSLPVSKIAWYLYPAYPALAIVLVEGFDDLLGRLRAAPALAAALWLALIALVAFRAGRSFRLLPAAPPNSLVRLARFVESRPDARAYYDVRLREPDARPREWNRFTIHARLAAEPWSPGGAPPAGRCAFLIGPERGETGDGAPPSVEIATQARSRPEPPLFVTDRCGGEWAAAAGSPARDAFHRPATEE